MIFFFFFWCPSSTGSWGLPSLRSHCTRCTCSARSGAKNARYVFYVAACVYMSAADDTRTGNLYDERFLYFAHLLSPRRSLFGYTRSSPSPSRRTKCFFAECPTRTVEVNKPSPESYACNDYICSPTFPPYQSTALGGMRRCACDSPLFGSTDRYTSNSKITGSYRIFVFGLFSELSKTRTVRAKTQLLLHSMI